MDKVSEPDMIEFQLVKRLQRVAQRFRSLFGGGDKIRDCLINYSRQISASSLFRPRRFALPRAAGFFVSPRTS